MLDYGKKMYMCLYQYMSVFEQNKGSKLVEMILSPFRKWHSFNKSRKDGKFDTDLVDSLLHTLLTLELANVYQLLTSTWKHYHTQWSPNIIQILWNMLCKARCVLSKEAMQPVPNVTYFLKLLKEFCFFVSWKEHVSFLSMLALLLCKYLNTSRNMHTHLFFPSGL